MIADAEYGALVIFTAQDMVDDVRRVLERTARAVSYTHLTLPTSDLV